MAHHVLSLEVPDVYNKCILRIMDTSIYDPLLPVNIFTLQVTVPGFAEPATITTLLPNYTVNLTACDLGIQTSNCGTTNNNLSDGIYVIKQSMAPNDEVYVEYNHLRISSALNRYQKALCCIDQGIACEPAPEIKKMILEARFIRTLFDTAKAQVEWCHQAERGMITYRYALARLEKLLLTCKGCKNC